MHAVDRVMQDFLNIVSPNLSSAEMRVFQDEFAQNNTENDPLEDTFDELEAYGIHEIDPAFEEQVERFMSLHNDPNDA